MNSFKLINPINKLFNTQYRFASLRVILLEDLPLKGSKGQIIKVKKGYARNFLIPRGVANYATIQNLTKYSTIIKEAEAKFSN